MLALFVLLFFIKLCFIFPAGCWQVFIAAAARRGAYPVWTCGQWCPYPCQSPPKSVIQLDTEKKADNFSHQAAAHLQIKVKRIH